MSKAKGNTVAPEELISTYGADTIRFFIIFASPPEQSLEWSDSGVDGAYRFLRRVWNFAVEHQTLFHSDLNIPSIDWNQLSFDERRIQKDLHDIFQKLNYDMERHQFNTVASACMKWLNALEELSSLEMSPQKNTLICEGLSFLLRFLYPITPHIAEYLWIEMGLSPQLSQAHWPEMIDIPFSEIDITLAVQINGKLRAEITVPKLTPRKQIEEMALNHAHVKKFIQGRPIQKIIIVPDRIVNIVI